MSGAGRNSMSCLNMGCDRNSGAIGGDMVNRAREPEFRVPRFWSLRQGRAFSAECRRVARFARGMDWRFASLHDQRHGLVEDSKTVAPRMDGFL